MSATPAPEAPRELLASTQALTRRVRSVQRGTWFPLLVFGAITLLAIPVMRYGHRVTVCTTGPAGAIRGCLVYPDTWFIYWPLALVGAYAAIAAFYVVRSRRRGVGTPVRPYVVAGVILAVVVTLVSLWDFHNPFGAAQQQVFRTPSLTPRFLFTGPLSAMGLGLLVLAWIERNRALLVFALVYLTVVLVPVTLGWVMVPPWFFLPRLVIAGVVLLLGAAGFALAERRRRPT